jgi:uncharacterized protein YraI
MKASLLLPVAAAATFAFLSPASAANATATADLNIRSGPGPQFSILGAVNANQSVTITGCIEGSKWCTIDHGGMQGWVYSDYLTADMSGSPVVLSERYADVGVPTVTYQPTGAGVVGAAGGAVAGALIGGPVGAVAGAAIGGATGVAAAPPVAVRDYVTSNPGEPVYLEGETAVGAALPATVALRPIPDYRYSYVNLNGQPVLVNPADRRIVYVMR